MTETLERLIVTTTELLAALRKIEALAAYTRKGRDYEEYFEEIRQLAKTALDRTEGRMETRAVSR